MTPNRIYLDGKSERVKTMRAKCLRIEDEHNGAKEFEVTVGRFYKVVDTNITSMSNEPYISVIGNFGVEVQRPQRNFKIMYKG